jgi:hypothetical protein
VQRGESTAVSEVRIVAGSQPRDRGVDISLYGGPVQCRTPVAIEVAHGPSLRQIGVYSRALARAAPPFGFRIAGAILVRCVARSRV